MSLPPPPTGSLGTVISSWFMNLKEDEEETCCNCISMPALMYASLVKTNNLSFLMRQKVRLLLSTLIVWLERKKNIYIYIKHYIKSEFHEQSILIKGDVLYDTCTWVKGKKIQILVVLRPCWAKWNAEITQRWILVLESSIVLKLQQVN